MNAGIVSEENTENNSISTEEYQSGFTWRVVLAIIYSAIIIQPAAIYLYFVTNSWFIGAVLNTTIVLFAVLAKLSDNPLSKQEVFIMINVTSTSLGMELIVQLIFNYYLRHHPMTKSTLINGTSLTEIIPDWYAPDYFGPVTTLFHPVFLFPILLFILIALLSKATDISLGIIFNYLYTKVEVLPFPTAVVEAERSKSLTWEDKKKLQIFSISAIVSSFFGFVLYSFPLVLGITLIPIPWYDFNSSIEGFLPGASLGIAIDVIAFGTGFILPMSVIVSLFLGSFLVNTVLNPILISNNLIPRWERGTSLIDTFNITQLDFWLPWTVAFLICASLIPVLKNPKIFYTTFRDLRRLNKGDSSQDIPSLTVLFSFFLLGTLGSVVVAVIVIPDLTLRLIAILILLTVFWSFLTSLTMSYALGITANVPVIPYIKESAFVATGTPIGNPIWFIPLVITSGGAGWVATFKTADLTYTKRNSLIKAHFLATFIAWIVGIFWVSALLSLSQVPSVIFPVPFWPLEVGRIITFVSNPTVVINPVIFLIVLIITILLYLVEWSAIIPLSVISLAVGSITPIPFAVTTLLGGFVALILKKRMNDWDSERAIIVAGLGAGVGIVISLSTFLSIIMKTIALSY